MSDKQPKYLYRHYFIAPSGTLTTRMLSTEDDIQREINSLVENGYHIKDIHSSSSNGLTAVIILLERNEA